MAANPAVQWAIRTRGTGTLYTTPPGPAGSVPQKRCPLSRLYARRGPPQMNNQEDHRGNMSSNVRAPLHLAACPLTRLASCARNVAQRCHWRHDTILPFLSFPPPVRRYCQVDERTMMEIYFPPFRAAVEAGVLAVMCAPARACAIHDRPTPVLFLAGAG